MEYSISPDGERFKIPEAVDYEEEFEKLTALAAEQQEAGREIVVVMGLGRGHIQRIKKSVKNAK